MKGSPPGRAILVRCADLTGVRAGKKSRQERCLEPSVSNHELEPLLAQRRHGPAPPETCVAWEHGPGRGGQPRLLAARRVHELAGLDWSPSPTLRGHCQHTAQRTRSARRRGGVAASWRSDEKDERRRQRTCGSCMAARSSVTMSAACTLSLVSVAQLQVACCQLQILEGRPRGAQGLGATSSSLGGKRAPVSTSHERENGELRLAVRGERKAGGSRTGRRGEGTRAPRSSLRTRIDTRDSPTLMSNRTHAPVPVNAQR